MLALLTAVSVFVISISEVEERFPDNVLCAGQRVFPRKGPFTRILHDCAALSVQKRLYYEGIPDVILPIRV